MEPAAWPSVVPSAHTAWLTAIMVARTWEVDTVRAQAKFLSITGAMRTVYYVLWRGFVAAEVQ